MTPQDQSLIEKEIDTLYQQTLRGERRGAWVGRLRRIVAYVLKIMAGGGSLAVATGYRPDWNQKIGAAILVAIFLDSVSANYKRLLAEVQAGYAFEFLRERVSRGYNRSLDPLLKQMKKAGADAASQQGIQSSIDALQQLTHKELTDGIRQIRERLADADLKALEALALDNERAAIQQGHQ